MMMMSTSPTVVFPSVAAGQQHERESRQRVSSNCSSSSSSSSKPPSLTPPKPASSRFSLADFPMPPPLNRPYSEPTPGYWQKLLATSSYAIRRRDTVLGEGRDEQWRD
ncbi:hypothetical protein BKA70DRAFT_1432422 [Coprinopsis sp. MPI-PUGE-AT-0042]|nr:hypothetical protein BKA70DRAFT_1432422 [Coprinopsis sp. MPI-PUGE-AT-0042]